MSKPLHFRVSSGLKDLIGKDLITDDYIAIFELVKNSYDAHATEVNIIFENILTDNGRVLIIDNGKGMDKKDIEDKWLFVAYSAKKDNTEEDEADQKNYRDKIRIKQYYAGAKGIGRFSCDRLGENLKLYSRKSRNESYHNINLNWKDFELDSKTEFVEVDVDYKEIKDYPNKINHGTILEITNLRSKWDKNKLIELREKLSRLITPTFSNSKTENSFKIIFQVEEFKGHDDEILKNQGKSRRDKTREIINGEIRNFVFETLNLKTTHIICEISGNQGTITTKLIDRNNEIYKIIEKNIYDNLVDVTFQVFFLNQTAKNNFTRIMGVEPIKYGNVFIYKNGFRIQPYGEPEYDTLGLDKRKTQGYARFLGTRDLMGRIEILGDNPELKEKTSRDGGLIGTATFKQFENCFYEKVIKRLEKYIVDVRNWGVDLEQESVTKIPSQESKENLVKLISNLANDKEIKVTAHPDIFKLIDINQKDSSRKIINNFKRIATESNNLEQLEKLEKLEKKFEKLEKAKKETELDLEATTELYEEENKKLNQRIIKVEKEKEVKEKEILFYKAATSKDSEFLVNLHHQTGISANTIENYLIRFGKKIKSGEKLSQEEMLNYLEKISFEVKKISTISKIASHANFNLASEKVKLDLVEYIEQYINTIASMNEDIISIKVSNNYKKRFNLEVKPIEITMLVDNFISNSKRAKATLVEFILESDDSSKLKITIRDNGKGLDKTVISKNEVFEKGFTTTNGSGLGLFHIQKIVKELGGTISVNPDLDKGIEFLIKVEK